MIADTMKTPKNSIYTPKNIVEYGIKFKIPLYQRLFTWNKEKIEVLLEDLYYHFKNSRDNHGEKKPYYLGIITQIKEENTDYHLVIDGQQRLTVLMLMAAVFAGKAFSSEDWQNFLCTENQYAELESDQASNGEDGKWKLRLLPFARNDDKNSLKTLITEKKRHDGKIAKPEMVTNKLMLEAIETISDFMDARFTKEVAKAKEFINDIYKHLTLLVTTLDASYLKRPEYLNKYFENMNSNYKNLENHEKLKIWLVGGHEDKDRLLEKWNKCEDLSIPLYKSVKKEDDPEEEIQDTDFETYWKNVEGSFSKAGHDEPNRKELWEIDAKPAPQNPFVDKSSRSIINFPQFLLLALDIFIEKHGAKTNEDNQQDSQKQENERAIQEKEEKKRQFYNTSALLSTFGDHLVSKIDHGDILKFYDLMLKLRVLLDFYVIRRVEDDDDSYSVMCCGKKDKATQELGWTPKKFECRLAQYQAMLDVAFPESFYKWLKPYLSYLYDAHFKKDEQWQIKLCPANEITSANLLEWLKKWDDQRLLGTAVAENKVAKKLDEILAPARLAYEARDRYWFWRLDYYLWENSVDTKLAQKFLINSDLDKVRQMEAIKAYRMRANRSIEHLHPQHSDQPWQQPADLNSFGNLAMISSSFNSTQSNNPPSVKFSRVIDHVDRGKLQSLKLLTMRKKGNGRDWEETLAREHGDEMITFLKESFGPIAASSQNGSQDQIAPLSQNEPVQQS